MKTFKERLSALFWRPTPATTVTSKTTRAIMEGPSRRRLPDVRDAVRYNVNLREDQSDSKIHEIEKNFLDIIASEASLNPAEA